MSSPAAARKPFDPKVLATLEGLEWRARYVMEGFLSGLHGSPFHGPSVEFRDYRDYQPGDDLRHLDWRLYARNDRLCVKRYEQETNLRCYVLCDTSASMSYRGASAWGSKMECARVLALALGWLLVKQNDAVGLLSLDRASGATSGPRPVRFVRPSQKPDQAGVLLRELDALTPLGGPGLAELLAHAARIVHRRSLLVLFSDLLEPSESVERAFKELRFHGHECVCFQVLDRDEIEFPFSDPVVLEDLETGERRRVPGRQARGSYRARFDAFMESYRGLFRALEMPHDVVRTDEDPGRSLARSLAARRRLR